jgi:cilia- and flagella-associated protein 57
MKLSHCNQYLFSTGQDGCLIIYDVNDRDNKDRKSEIALPYSDQVLTLPSQLEEYKNTRDQKQAENAALNSTDNFSSMINNKKLEEVKQQLTEEIATNSIQENTKQEQLSSEKSTKESQFQDSLNKIDLEFAAAKEDQKAKYSKQMLEDSTRHQELVKQKENKSREGEEAIQNLIEMEKQSIESIKQQHKKQMESEHNQIDSLEKEIEVMQEKHQEILKQIAEDAENEKKQISTKNQSDIQRITDFCLKSKADLQLNKNKNKDLTNEIEQLKRDISDKEHLLFTQKTTNEDLKEDKSKKDKEIGEKDNIIGDKEKQIYQYKKKTQELEKFKFVLDYKIRELKAEIAPRERETEKLKVMTNDMDTSLKYFNKVNANLGIIVDDLRAKQDKMQKLIIKNRTAIRKNDILIKSFKDDVYESVQYIDDPNKLQSFTHEMFTKYVKDKGKKTVDINPEIRKEYDNQRKYLENSKHSLDQKLKKDMALHKKDSQKHMKENYKLIEQINKLRKRKDELLSKTRKSELSSTSVDNSDKMSRGKMDRSSHAALSQDDWVANELRDKKEMIQNLRERIEEERNRNLELKQVVGAEV